MRSLRPLLTGLLLLCVIRVPGGAGETEVYIQPRRAHLGAGIRIFGFVQPGREPARVRIELRKPKSGENLVQLVDARENGEFEWLFEDADETGFWKVKVNKEATRDVVEESFQITSGVFLGKLADDLSGLSGTESEAGREFRDLLEDYPVFPGKDDMLARAAEALRMLDDLRDHLDRLREADRKLEQSLEDHAGVPEAAREALREAAAGAGRLSESARREDSSLRELFEQSRRASEWCRRWSVFKDIFDRMGFFSNFMTDSITEIASNLNVALGVSQMPYEVSQAIWTVVHVLGVAVTGEASVLGATAFLVNTFSGLSSASYDELLQNCTRFSGTMEGEYSARLEINGAPYFFMSYKLSAEVDLVFQKIRPGDPAVHLRGQVSGHVSDFDASLEMGIFMPPGTMIPSWTRIPVPALSGRTFFMSLAGKAENDRLEIGLEDVSHDFELKAKGYYVILSLHAPIPLADVLEFPLMDAEWFFTRVTEISRSDPKSISLRIENDGAQPTVTGEFERSMYIPPGPKRAAVRVSMTMRLHLCSPECGRLLPLDSSGRTGGEHQGA